jgi:phenol hydroxylase P4 protein
MAIKSLNGYVDIVKDAVENFHGNQLVYVDWFYHRLFTAAAAFPLPPEMPFGALMQEVIPSVYGSHPDFADLDWAKVEWELDGEDFSPDPEASLADNGVGHKSMLIFKTPELGGIQGSGN